MIQFFRRLENLKVAGQMTDHETKQNESGDGHDGFLADSGLPEAQGARLKIYGSDAHGVYWSFWVQCMKPV